MHFVPASKETWKDPAKFLMSIMVPSRPYQCEGRVPGESAIAAAIKFVMSFGDFPYKGAFTWNELVKLNPVSLTQIQVKGCAKVLIIIAF